ncbi:MAG: hypothetical protein BA863_08370 [Desulfovibrio sp. S3730MH75]|nr:MAG: hypothetical protein BA863_08370 [Desulfovibrio sp. S3730MH75]
MFVKKIPVFLFIMVLVASLFWCRSARAFFPSDEAIDDTMYQKYGALTSYEALITFPSEPGTSLRIKRGDDRWQQIFVSNAGGNGTITAKSIGQYFETSAECPVNGDLPVSPLQFWVSDDPTSDWKSLGMTNSTRSYGFNDGLPVFVFGAESTDDFSPQIRLDNENFAPLKITLGAGRSISFGTYTKFAGFMLPHTGIIAVGEDSVEFKIEWLGVRQKIDPAVFSAATLKKESLCGIPNSSVLELLKKCLRIKP